MRSSILCLTCNRDSLITDPDSGEVICSQCGHVMTDRNNENRPEWELFQLVLQNKLHTTETEQERQLLLRGTIWDSPL